MSALETFAPDTPPDRLVGALDRDGAVIIADVMSRELRARIADELGPYLDSSARGLDEFTGTSTTRTGALAARSAGCRDLITHPAVQRLCDAVLLRNAERYIVNLTQAIRLLPGQPAQALHRDRGLWGPYLPGSIEPQLGTLWALTPFTRENGATRIVPGSQHWIEGRDPLDAEITEAVMTAGSVLLYTGSVIHGGGANRSDGERIGINVTYCLAWLRQEENQYLSCPPHIARSFDPRLQELLGYTMGGYALGYFSPLAARTGAPDTVPPEFAVGRLPEAAPRGTSGIAAGFVPDQSLNPMEPADAQ